MKRALITGVTGQDGSYLAEFLLDKGYEVYGLVRRSSVERFERIAHIINKLTIIQGDLTDQSSLDEAIRKIKPDEVYNLASQSFVPASWNQPALTVDVGALGVVRILEAIRKNDIGAKYYQASSSEIFGSVRVSPQNELTHFHPRSPYGAAKTFAHYLTVNYRESYGMFACSGILFNHESPRRGLEFVTRKVTNAVAKIKLGLQEQLVIGNLNARRDWGYAGDYVRAMWMMLQHELPDDYVIAMGKMYSVRDLIEEAFHVIDVDIQWKGEGIQERGINVETGKELIIVSPELFRPAEVDFLVGDASKARTILKWKPEVNFQELVKIMIDADIKRLTLSPKELLDQKIAF